MDISTRLSKVRRRIASFSLGLLVASLFVTGAAQAQTFSDVTPDLNYYNAVEQGVSEGWINGSFSTFRPADFANRYEAAMVAYKAFGYDKDPYTPTTPSFKDPGYGPSHWAYTAVETLVKHGVIAGYNNTEGQPTGLFGGGDRVTRSQWAKIVVNSAPLTENTTGGPHFPDVPVSHPLYSKVETAYNWSVVNGYPDGSFKPDNNINRAEIALMTARALSPVARPGAGFSVKDASSTGLNAVQVCFSAEPGTGATTAANYAVTDVDGNKLNVSSVAMDTTNSKCVDLTTDNQTASKHYDVAVTGVKSSSGEDLMANQDPVSFTGYTGTPVGGALTCAPGTQPQGVSVPKGATGVNFAVVNCTAGADAVTVSGMTWHRFGAGNETDFTNVYLYADDYRVTTGRSINSETQMVEFGGLNYQIPAGKTVSFWVAGDISVNADSAAQHAFELMNADAIVSNASSVNLSTAVQGNLFTVSGATAGSITIAKNGSLDEVTTGQTARIAQFLLTANGTEAMKLERLALYVRGTCDASSISTFSLMVEGSNEVLATADAVGSKDLVTFVLDNPYTIDQGSNKVFYVMAKNTCRNTETIKTYLDETTDLHVTGLTFGTGVQVVNNYNGSTGNFSEVTVKGSTFNVAFNGPAAGDIAIGQKQAMCEKFTITNAGTADVEIKNWDITMNVPGVVENPNGLIDTASTPHAANYTLIKLVKLNADGSVGSTLLGPSELSITGDDSSQPVTLSGDQTVKAGESFDAAVVFDVSNNTAIAGDSIRCTLTNLATEGSDYIRDMNGDQLGAESITPATNITGNTFNVSGSGLTFEVSSKPSSRTWVSGANNAGLLGLTVRSGSSLANTVKSITLTGYVDGSTNGTFTAGSSSNDTSAVLKDIVDSVALYNGATMVSDVKNINADGTIVFNNLNIFVPKSTTINLTLQGHINNSAPYYAQSDRVAFSIDHQSDVVAIDSNGQNVATGSINVGNALNTGNAPHNHTIMTIASGGTGTVAEQGSLARKIMIGNSPETDLAKFKFTSDNEDVSLRKVTLGTLNRNGASLEYVKLYTGSDCSKAVPLLSGGDSGQFTSNGTTGLFTIEGLNLTITDAGDTFLCVKGATPSVSGSGDPVSGDNVGVVLVDVPEIIGGSGTNVAGKYIGDASKADTLNVAMTNLDTTLVATNGTNIGFGDVLIVDQEQMLVTQDASNPSFTVARGFGATTPAAHAAGAKVYVSRLTSGGAGLDSIAAQNPTATDTCLDVTTPANYKVGDVLGLFETSATAFDYALVTKVTNAGLQTADCAAGDFNAADDIVVVRGLFGSTVIDHTASANITFLNQRGNMDPLRASVPTFTNVAVTGGAVGSGTYTVLKFDVAATGENDVNFKKGVTDNYDPTAGDSLLTVQLFGSTNAGEIGTCTLRNVTDNEVLDTANLTSVALSGNSPTSIDVDFNFSTNALVISPGTKKTVEVQCDLNIIGGSGRSVSARIVEGKGTAGGDWIGSGDGDPTAYDVTAPSVVVYSDGDDTTVDEDGSLIDNLPLFGPSFNSTAT